MKTLPFIFSISPRRADSNDDFPLPTWPTIATREPVFALIFNLRVGVYAQKLSNKTYKHVTVTVSKIYSIVYKYAKTIKSYKLLKSINSKPRLHHDKYYNWFIYFDSVGFLSSLSHWKTPSSITTELPSAGNKKLIFNFQLAFKIFQNIQLQ